MAMKIERIDYWVRQGAQLSDRVAKIVKDYRKQTSGTPVEDAVAEGEAAA